MIADWRKLGQAKLLYGKLLRAKSSSEASGTEITGSAQIENLPYRQSETYNAFGDMTERYSKIWGADVGLTTTYTFNEHHRVTGAHVEYQFEPYSAWGYDAEGRVTQTYYPELISEMKYDAAGRISFKHDKRSPGEHEDKATAYYDGDGREIKRVTDACRISGNETCDWEGESARYYIRSTVLGGEVIAEANAYGPLHRYAYAGGAKFAELTYRYAEPIVDGHLTQYDAVQYFHIDSAGVSQRVTRNSPETLLGTNSSYSTYIDPRQQEYDSGMSNVGTVTSYIQQPAPPSDPPIPIDGDAFVYADGQWIPVYQDGLPMSRQALAAKGIRGYWEETYRYRLGRDGEQVVPQDISLVDERYIDLSNLRRLIGQVMHSSSRWDDHGFSIAAGQSISENPCEMMAGNAQVLIDHLNNFPNLTPAEKLVEFSRSFQTWYTGGGVGTTNWSAFWWHQSPQGSTDGVTGHYSNLPWNAWDYNQFSGRAIRLRVSSIYRGQKDFLSIYRQYGTGERRGDGEDQTHHFAAYFALGASGLSLAAWARWEDSEADKLLGEKAYSMGDFLRRNPFELKNFAFSIRSLICVPKPKPRSYFRF